MGEERKLKDQMLAEIEREGGTARKCEWVNRRGAPDWLVWVPRARCPFWVELKAQGEALEPHQAREHARMRQEGHTAFTVHTLEGFRELVAALRS